MFISTMFHGYVYKYLVVLVFVNNAVADISLDYYFGNDKSLRSTIKIGDCTGDALIQSCYRKCGPNHACILDQCFCVKVTDPPQELDVLVIGESSDEDTASESIEDEDDDEDDYYDDSDDDSDDDSNDDSDDDDDDDDDEEDSLTETSSSSSSEEETRPILRHHIAHFCPNLHVARNCIKKCMKLGKPAFCGKDHHCYCGHRYDYPAVDPNVDPADIHVQFKDLYEKYFGPKHKVGHPIKMINKKHD